jgi:hypothetical protein
MFSQVLVVALAAGGLVLMLSAVPAGARTYIVDAAHPNARDEGDGSEKSPLKTISAAARLAGPGDTVLVHPGIYRERVAPARGGQEGNPVTYRALHDAVVVSPTAGAVMEPDAAKLTIVRGSEVWSPQWRGVDGAPGVYHTQTKDDATLSEYNAFMTPVRESRGAMTQGQLFVDGACLKQVASEAAAKAQAGTWYAQASSGELWVNFPEGKAPGKCIVEVSVRKRVFAPLTRGLSNVVVRGFVFEHAANDVCVPQMGMVSCRSGSRWVIERNVIRHARSVGLDCGNEWGVESMPAENDGKARMRNTGEHVIYGNIVSDNGQCGITGLRSLRTRIVGNVVERNAQTVPGFESGGIKVHFFYDGLMEGNLVRDNDAWGIWLDHGWEGARVTRNVIVNNKPSGIFWELGEDRQGRGLADNNIIAMNRGDGVYTHDASDVWLVNNLILANETNGVFMHVATSRAFTRRVPGRGQSSCQRQHVLNNLILGNKQAAVSFPMPGGRAKDNISDWNIFAPGAGGEVGFRVNLGNGAKVDAASVMDAAQKAFEESGDPGLSPDLVAGMKATGPTVGLKQWQVLLGCDASSLVSPPPEASLDLKTLSLTLAPAADWSAFECPAVEGVWPRFEGDAPRGKKVAPGPLPSLDKPVRLKVWPVSVKQPDLPTTEFAAPASRPAP